MAAGEWELSRVLYCLSHKSLKDRSRGCAQGTTDGGHFACVQLMHDGAGAGHNRSITGHNGV